MAGAGMVERLRWSSPVTWLLAALLLFIAGAVTASMMGATRQAAAQCDVRKATALDGCDLTRDQEALHDADLRSVSMRGAILDGLRLQGVNLAGAHLEGASLRNTWLSEATLANTWLYRADLRGSTLTSACLRGARLEGADLTDANLVGADMTAAETNGARGLTTPPKPAKAPQSCAPKAPK